MEGDETFCYVPSAKLYISQVWEEVLSRDSDVLSEYHENPGVSVTENAKERLARAAKRQKQLDDEFAVTILDPPTEDEKPSSAIL